MAKYIEVVNNNSVVSVDDTQARLSLKRSVPLNSIGYDKSHGYSWDIMHGCDQYCIKTLYRFPIQLATNEKMFSIRALADNPHTGFSRLANGDSASYLYAYQNRYNTIGFDNYVIDFYGYDTAKTGSFGLQVFDANGNIIFNSNKYYFDVSGQYNVQHTDGTAYEFANQPSVFPRRIDIGSYSRKNSAVVLNVGAYNACKFVSNYDTPYDLVYTIVFGNTLYLEPRIAYWEQSWSTWSTVSNHNGFPNFARLSSGIILDTTNIS